MAGKVLVTGLGVISAIGKNKTENLDALVNERSGIGNIDLLETIHKDEIPIAEVKYEDSQLMDILKIGDIEGYTRTALFGIIAANEAVRDAGLSREEIHNMGVISATTVGGMVKSEQHYLNFLSNDKSNIYIGTHDNSDNTRKIAEYVGADGIETTISTACSSSANSIMLGARMIRHGMADRALVGGTDALSRFTLNGFNTLMILDRDRCKPFDKNRNGLTLGEGAAFIVLESEKSVEDSQREHYCELKGWANANDAYHQTASSSSGKGATMAMNAVLEVAGLRADEIDYINAHGTGTINNDLSEGMAIMNVFGKKIPLVSSTKSFTGHTLGASGSVEAVFSVMALKNKFVWNNLFFKERIEELSLSPVTQTKKALSINNVLSNSFGFGGNNTSLIFSQ